MDEQKERKDYEDIPLRGIRKVISARLVQSKAPVPHFYVTTEIDMERIIELRNSLKEKGITFNDIILKLTALTVKKHPVMTSGFLEDRIRKYNSVHLGFAVSVEDGLIAPVIKDCDKKDIEEISAESKLLSEKARNRRLRRHEYEGAVFTVSNLGMFNVDNFSAIINPPEGAALAVGSIIKKPVVIEDKIEVRNRMKVTVSCDHRVIDGAEAAQFLKTLKSDFENPVI